MGILGCKLVICPPRKINLKEFLDSERIRNRNRETEWAIKGYHHFLTGSPLAPQISKTMCVTVLKGSITSEKGVTYTRKDQPYKFV